MDAESAALRREAVTRVLVPLFFVSGATGLVYQSLWARSLHLVFGTSTLAIATVLAAFMAGLALGGWGMAARADRARDPIRVYGWLEIGIGLYAWVFPWIVGGISQAYTTLFQGMEPSPWLFGLIQFFLVTLALLAPTTMMGATLPLLARYATDRLGAAGDRVGTLYASNTAGAVFGTVVCGFIALPTLGHTWTNGLAAAANIALGIGALALARWAEGSEMPPMDAVPVRAGRRWPLLLATAVAGFAALVDEVAWTRVLVLMLGGSVYAFSTMLAALLTGLAVGGSVGGRAADALSRRWGIGALLFGLALAQLGVALASYGTMGGFEELPYRYVVFFDMFDVARHPYAAFVGGALLASTVMFVPSMLMGMTFPLAVRAVLRGDGALGEPVGSVYGANTAGAVVGAFVGGFLLLPVLGVQRTLYVAMAANALAAVSVLALREIPVRLRILGLTLVVVSAPWWSGTVGRPEWNPLWMTSGMYTYVTDVPEAQRTREGLRAHAIDRYLLRFYAEGPASVVTVAQSRATGSMWLANNGKVDASTSIDMPTQLLVALMPFPWVPAAPDVLVIGLASGITAGAVSLVPDVQRLDIVELEPATLAAAALFREHNFQVLEDPRAHVVINDGRNHVLRAAPASYDVIVSEPSNPWLTGVSNLFTREFLELGRTRLKPGGVWAQWVQIYGMGEEDLRSLVATFAAVYPHVEVFSTIEDSDLVILGSDRPLPMDAEVFERFRTRAPRAAAALDAVKLGDPYDLLSTRLMGQEGVRAFSEGADLNTDDNLRIEYSAPLHLYFATASTNMEELVAHAERPATLDALAQARLARAYLRRDDLDRSLASMWAAFALPGSPNAAQTAVVLRALGDASERATPELRAEWVAFRSALATWASTD